MCMSSAIEPPQSHTRRAQDYFWQQGFCENQLQQCSTQIEWQKESYPWIQMEERLALVDADENGAIAALRQIIANYAEVDYAGVPEISGSDKSEAIQVLQEALDSLGRLDVVGLVSDALWSTLGAVENAIASIVTVFGNSVLGGLYEVQDILQFLRILVLPPVALFTVLTTAARPLIALVNSAYSLLTGDDLVESSPLCFTDLFGCSLEMLSRYLIITVTGAVLSFVS